VGSGLRPGLFLGHEGGELFGHLWVIHWHAEALPAWPSGTDLALGAEPWPVIDPLTTLTVAVLSRVFGAVSAWNALVLGAVALAYVGGAALGRRVGGAPAVAGVLVALSPPLLGSLSSGLSEDAGLGLLALAYAALLGEGFGMSLLGGALLGLTAASGLVLGALGALGAVVLGLVDLWRRPARLGRWLSAALLALALAAPAAWSHATRLGGEGHRSGAPMEQPEPAWRLNPWRGADLASFVAVGEAQPPEGA
jgi:hypothetical protein